MGLANSRMTTPCGDDPGVGPGIILTGGALASLSGGTHGRYVCISTAGNIVGQLYGETVDQTYVIPVGVWPMAFKSVTSSTAVGFILR